MPLTVATGIGDAEFAGLIEPLGPFEPAPLVAIACSGGADSLALTVLANGWARARGGSALALVIDHALRDGSAAEVAATVRRLAARGIAALPLRLTIAAGAGLAERAREARYAALAGACRTRGVLHLLLGHHAADQAETVLIRALSGSGPAGLAGMAPLVETADMRLLRPLLDVAPARLRATLIAAGLEWIEDPSNADRRALRPRLRGLRADRDGTGPATRALVASATAAGRSRAAAECLAARALAESVVLRPEGFALLRPGPVDLLALGWLIRVIGGAAHAPSPGRVATLAAALSGPVGSRSATLGGVRFLPAGRFGPGLLAVREPVAMQAPVPAIAGACWDGRFRIGRLWPGPDGLALGALGTDAAGFRDRSGLPTAVLRALPALRRGARLFSVPHLSYSTEGFGDVLPLVFEPRRPSADAAFAAA